MLVKFENKIHKAKIVRKEIKFNYDIFVGENSSNMGFKFCMKNYNIYNSNM